MKSEFQDKCYKLLALVPKGKVTTYKSIAKALNSKAYRSVGSAMKQNSTPVLVPCHRVVLSNGSVGGYSGKEGVKGKIQLLRSEGVEIKNGKINLSKFLHKP